jgi:uncharacterized protein (DUF427 family)
VRPGRIEPGPGQESVWDYPRPPRLEAVAQPLRVEYAGQIVLATTRALRVLETSHPPTYYLPAADLTGDWLRPGAGSSHCEFKGRAVYWDLVVGDEVSPAAAWSYPEPTRAYARLAGHLAFYPSRVEACYVGEERVQAQAGDFYGGWITTAVVGPFKGGPGSWGW